MRRRNLSVQREDEAVSLPMWRETLVAIEIAFLHASPIYYGFGIPKGDGSAVVVIPGFLGTDWYLVELRAWLRRIGYKTYVSGIGLNAECPNLLIRHHLEQTMDKAYRQTRRKIHLIGHSLGGVLARAAARQRPDRVASVITLGAPFRGAVVHPTVLQAARMVREQILHQHGKSVLPDCYTGQCTCNFIQSLLGGFPPSMPQTAIYTKTDGIVDWHVCLTGDPSIDFEVSSTHVGLVFNPIVYEIIAKRLSLARERRPRSPRTRKTRKKT